jgi:hypothetical protein
MIIIYNFYFRSIRYLKKNIYCEFFQNIFFWIVCFSKHFNELEKKEIFSCDYMKKG